MKKNLIVTSENFNWKYIFYTVILFSLFKYDTKSMRLYKYERISAKQNNIFFLFTYSLI